MNEIKQKNGIKKIQKIQTIYEQKHVKSVSL